MNIPMLACSNAKSTSRLSSLSMFSSDPSVCTKSPSLKWFVTIRRTDRIGNPLVASTSGSSGDAHRLRQTVRLATSIRSNHRNPSKHHQDRAGNQSALKPNDAPQSALQRDDLAPPNHRHTPIFQCHARRHAGSGPRLNGLTNQVRSKSAANAPAVGYADPATLQTAINDGL